MMNFRLMINCLVLIFVFFVTAGIELRSDTSAELTPFPVPPIELIYFFPELREEGVLLKWGTATEVSNFGFFVERTLSPQSTFENIGFVEGNGNSHSPKHYTFLDTTVVINETYYYRLKQVDFDGTFEYSDTVSITFVTLSVEKQGDQIPEGFELHQNYPNPFNPETVIMFDLPEPGEILLKVTDNIGRIVATLFSGYLSGGSYKTSFNAAGLSSGIYYCILSGKNYQAVRKLVLLK